MEPQWPLNSFPVPASTSLNQLELCDGTVNQRWMINSATYVTCMNCCYAFYPSSLMHYPSTIGYSGFIWDAQLRSSVEGF